MYKLAICDDNPSHLENLSELVKQIWTLDTLKIYKFSDSKAILQAAEEIMFDLVLVDILLERENDGIQVAQSLNQKLPLSKIIFITAHLEYATDIYSAKHFYFILKSQLRERLPDVLKQATESLQEEQSQVIWIKVKKESIKISTHTILYMERRLRKTYLYGPSERGIATTKTLNELQALLPAKDFVRCHGSYLVNKAKISAIRNKELTLVGNKVIPISRTYSSVLKQLLF